LAQLYRDDTMSSSWTLLFGWTLSNDCVGLRKAQELQKGISQVSQGSKGNNPFHYLSMANPSNLI